MSELWSLFLENFGHHQPTKIVITKKCPRFARIHGNTKTCLYWRPTTPDIYCQSLIDFIAWTLSNNNLLLNMMMMSHKMSSQVILIFTTKTLDWNNKQCPFTHQCLWKQPLLRKLLLDLPVWWDCTGLPCNGVWHSWIAAGSDQRDCVRSSTLRQPSEHSTNRIDPVCVSFRPSFLFIDVSVIGLSETQYHTIVKICRQSGEFTGVDFARV